METNFSLTIQQIKDIARAIDLQDVKSYIENNKEEYEKFLEEENYNNEI